MVESLWSWCRDPGFFPITPLKSPMLPMSPRLSEIPTFMESSGESLCKEMGKTVLHGQENAFVLVKSKENLT